MEKIIKYVIVKEESFISCKKYTIGTGYWKDSHACSTDVAVFSTEESAIEALKQYASEVKNVGGNAKEITEYAVYREENQFPITRYSIAYASQREGKILYRRCEKDEK